MSTQQIMTKQEEFIGIAMMAGGFAFGHAVAMYIGRGVGVSVGLAAMIAAVLIYSHLVKHAQSLDFPVQVKMRRLVAALAMPGAGAIGTFNHFMVDGGLLLAALVMALCFLWLGNKEHEA